MSRSLHLACVLASLLTSVSQAAVAAKTNVLFICIDDMRPQTAAYGQKHMLTPNLDKIASEGRLFRRHYVQVPTCGPSRASMLTGRTPRSGDEINHHALSKKLAGTTEPEQPETLVHHFRQHGYHTVGMGKISHSENGYRYDKETKTGGPELPHSWSEFVKLEMPEWKGSLLHGFVSGKDRKKGGVAPFESAEVEDIAYPDGMLAELAKTKLTELSEHQQPFFMAVGFYKPHLPFTAPRKYWDLYDRSELPLSTNPELPAAVDAEFLHNSNEFRSYRDQPEQAAAGTPLSDDYARQIIHAHCAAVSFVDAQVGKVLDHLRETGLDKNTIVVLWGDHG
ncbi:sulfatase-like hydrolase/transferase [Luteolibacter algae]|uniref:Sulfatase-like hydrolase/transferase n=1 Tax=Luteolibacter algae TaxID=454151 RepID=A0ABW5D436_9BACT